MKDKSCKNQGIGPLPIDFLTKARLGELPSMEGEPPPDDPSENMPVFSSMEEMLLFVKKYHETEARRALGL